MKITQLTPGTGSFHCGSCLRDLALTRALRAMGYDIALVPLYLPLVDDGDAREESSDGVDDLSHVELGGVAMYLREKSAVARALPHWATAWLDAPWLLRRASKRVGMTAPDELGRMTLSMLRGEHGRQLKELRHLGDTLAKHGVPDVLSLSNVMLAGMAGSLKRRLGVPVVCTLQGEDWFLDELPEPWRGRSWGALAEACRGVDRFIAVSAYYAAVMTERLQLDPLRVEVAHNGIDLTGFPALGESLEPPAVPTIGFLAHLRPEKGLHTLVDAFVLLKKNSLGLVQESDGKGQPHPHPGPAPERGREYVDALRLCVVGTTTAADGPYIAEQKAKLAAAGLSDDVEFHTDVSRQRKLELLRAMTVLSVPAEYGESFGLYVLEANAMGVPAVQPDSGAFGEVLGATGGGMLCGSADAGALAAGLTAVLGDAALRERLGSAGRASVWRDFSSAAMAERVAGVLERACRADLK